MVYLKQVAQWFISAAVISLFLVLLAFLYLLGLTQGYNIGKSDAEIEFIEQINSKFSEATPLTNPTPVEYPQQIKPTQVQIKWGGPDLWDQVNKRRLELGVNALSKRDELCTIASIRLNELLELGKLDAHAGFANLESQRPDLKWVFDKYSVLSEFLASGGKTAQETVNMWENTLGHRKILDGGEYVWGCIYAQDSYAVGIVAY